MKRVPFVAGNWKMNTTIEAGVALAADVAKRAAQGDVDVAVLPPFTHLWPVAEELKGTKVGVGAQDVYWEKSGAYTGEISVEMLRGCCRYVLVGHSERRHLFGETDEDVARKSEAVLGAGLRLIVAVGETEAERDRDATRDVIARQVKAAMAVAGGGAAARVDVAYEPVWAIGTGRTATPEQAQEVCAFIRGLLRDALGDEAAETMRILYGGSVNAGNAAELFSRPDIDGGLIGGASLDPEAFAAIIGAARVTTSA